MPRSPVADRRRQIFEGARPHPFLDQADDALVADPVFDARTSHSWLDLPEEV
ncbi:MAG: hypothetical protein ACR2KT_04700 [Methylocella sp.]